MSLRLSVCAAAMPLQISKSTDADIQIIPLIDLLSWRWN
jgi:hypothetical protein